MESSQLPNGTWCITCDSFNADYEYPEDDTMVTCIQCGSTEVLRVRMVLFAFSVESQQPYGQHVTAEAPTSMPAAAPAPPQSVPAPSGDEFEDITDMPMDGPPVPVAGAPAKPAAEPKETVFTSEDPIVEEQLAKLAGQTAGGTDPSVLPDVPADEGLPPQDESRINK